MSDEEEAVTAAEFEDKQRILRGRVESVSYLKIDKFYGTVIGS